MDKVLRILETIPKGRKYAVRSDVIRRITGVREGRTEETVRKIIHDLIFEDEIPIGSCSKGYFIIETEEELEDAVRDLERRAEGCLARARQLKANFLNGAASSCPLTLPEGDGDTSAHGKPASS